MERSAEPVGQAPLEADAAPLERRWTAGDRNSDAARVLRRAGAALRDPTVAIGLLLVAACVLRFAWLAVPRTGLIFDEAYYVNAARVILGWQPTNHYADAPAGLDPNTEHPELGKLVIAGSMLVFGDNGFAWRLPSVVAGMVALVAVWLIVRELSRSRWLAVLVTGLVAFDNLTFVHGRIGTLDILFVAPVLLGAWLALRGRWVLAGVAMGVALLVKLPALYGVGAVVLYLLLTEGPRWWRDRRVSLAEIRGPIGFVVITFSIAIGGLSVLDTAFTRYASPVDHIVRMVSYGTALRAPQTAGFCPEADSRPWQWVFNECQINYLRVDNTIRAGDKVVSKTATIDFRGAMNPLLAGAIPVAALFSGWYAWRTRNRLALWAVAWGAANYLPYLLLAALTPRIMYLYYVVPLVPAIAIAVALLLTRSGLPRPVLWGFVAAYAVGFVAYFPFRQIP